MAKRAPYFFKISIDRKDPWDFLGCFGSAEEACVSLKEKIGEEDCMLVRGKTYHIINGKLFEG